MSTGQTPSAEEDYRMWLKATEQLLMDLVRSFSPAVSKVKNELSNCPSRLSKPLYFEKTTHRSNSTFKHWLIIQALIITSSHLLLFFSTADNTFQQIVHPPHSWHNADGLRKMRGLMFGGFCLRAHSNTISTQGLGLFFFFWGKMEEKQTLP